MKKSVIVLLLGLFCCQFGMAQKVMKSVSILGDSYSTYEGYMKPDTNAIWYWRNFDPKKTDVASVRETWWHQFIKENGYKLCVNNSYSGTTICNTGYKDAIGKFADNTHRSFIARMNDLGNPDIIFIFGGTNDSWAGVPMGEYKYADWTWQDLYYFRPALSYLLTEMKDHYPNVEIYFILNTRLREEINESVKTICTKCGIDCIVLTEFGKMAGHPSRDGMKSISEQIKAYLDKK